MHPTADLIPLPGPSLPALAVLPLAEIETAAQNPRSAVARDDALAGLAASLGDDPGAPLIAQFPVVERAGGRYRLILGERRIQAARERGLSELPCLVHDALDPATAHTLRVVENLHRAPMDPLDEALALKVSWLLFNADALGLGAPARARLAQGEPLAATLAGLQALIVREAPDFSPTRPLVPWAAALDRLGVQLDKQARKRLMRVLRIEPELYPALRNLGLTEAALRAIGTLQPDAQRALVAALEASPELARKVRRVCKLVAAGRYSLADALDEARAQTGSAKPAGPVYGFGEPAVSLPGAEAPVAAPAHNPDLEPAVFALTDAVARLEAALTRVKKLAGGPLAALPEPWNGTVSDALALGRALIEQGESA